MQQPTDVRSIAIVGAGAMGAAYGSMFADAGCFAPYFLASGQRYHRLSQQELQVNSKSYAIPVKKPEDVNTPADLVIVALKHHHLPEALPLLQPVVGRETIILSVMNGLDSEKIIGSEYGMDKLVLAIAVGIDAVREEECFTYAQPGNIIFGVEPHNDDDHRITRLSDTLTLAGIPNEVSTDILRTMWWKFMINVGINQASAVLRAPYGIFQKSAEARGLMLQLMQEVVDLAIKINIDLSRNDLNEWLAILSSLGPTGKTSMLQDMEAGRKTEVEIFAGKVISLGREYSLPTPANTIILQIIKAIEHKNSLDIQSAPE